MLLSRAGLCGGSGSAGLLYLWLWELSSLSFQVRQSSICCRTYCLWLTSLWVASSLYRCFCCSLSAISSCSVRYACSELGCSLLLNCVGSAQVGRAHACCTKHCGIAWVVIVHCCVVLSLAGPGLTHGVVCSFHTWMLVSGFVHCVAYWFLQCQSLGCCHTDDPAGSGCCSHQELVCQLCTGP